MNRKLNMAALVLLVCIVLCGCGMRTVDQMYAVPRRSAEYEDLQIAIDNAMMDLQYCAPVSGENRQSVQMADLDGDGEDEYLLFAKGSTDDPLKIFIFDMDFSMVQILESRGTRFETVEYIDMDNVPGKELVVGVQVSDQVLGYMSVYSFADSQPRQMMVTNYSKFVPADLDMDGLTDLMVIAPGSSAEDNAVVTLYRWQKDSIVRSRESMLSGSQQNIKRIMVSPIHGGENAVYVASSLEENAIITDVFALKDGHFTNVSLSNESGTSMQTLRNHYVYADDIDDDGILELPCLMDMVSIHNLPISSTHHLIRWYSMTIHGQEVEKMYTFHDYDAGWYLTLDREWASRISVVREGSAHTFYVWNANIEKAEKLLTIHALSGPDRDLEARLDDRIELHKTDATIYAAKLEVAALSYGLTPENLQNSFHLIQRDWMTGET